MDKIIEEIREKKKSIITQLNAAQTDSEQNRSDAYRKIDFLRELQKRQPYGFIAKIQLQFHIWKLKKVIKKESDNIQRICKIRQQVHEIMSNYSFLNI